MSSPNLQAEYERLLNAIAQIRASGNVAPAYCWLTTSTVTRGTKIYRYARLVTEHPGEKPKIHSLGKEESDRHQHWKQAIARREAIAELEQQLKLLQELIERQSATWEKIGQVLDNSQED